MKSLAVLIFLFSLNSFAAEITVREGLASNIFDALKAVGAEEKNSRVEVQNLYCQPLLPVVNPVLMNCRFENQGRTREIQDQAGQYPYAEVLDEKIRVAMAPMYLMGGTIAKDLKCTVSECHLVTP